MGVTEPVTLAWALAHVASGRAQRVAKPGAWVVYRKNGHTYVESRGEKAV